MTKFLHISDIHLGIKRYGVEERTRDFFYAWNDCLTKYAINESVDFVLIGGDLFDRRQIDPQAANHAIIGLEKLKAAGIAVFAIEGNHDQRETGSNFSWLKSLSQWKFLKLLEPVHKDGKITYVEWNEENREGSFIDYKDVRIFGSRWYGVTTSNLIPQLQAAIHPNLREDGYNIMMLHTEVEGQVNRPVPALATSKLLQLRQGIDYLALGHIHKNFVVDNWAYNPGSLEAASIDEYKEVRGAYLVELKDGQVNARLVRDYKQRLFLLHEFDLSTYTTAEEGTQALRSFLLDKCSPDRVASEPIVDVVLKGRLSFKSSLLKLEEVKNEILKQRSLLEVIFRNETVPIEYAVAADLGATSSRSERELRVMEDLVSHDPRFKKDAEKVAGLVLEMKRQILTGESTDKLFSLLQQQIEGEIPISEEAKSKATSES